jgi:hypothetical protein
MESLHRADLGKEYPRVGRWWDNNIDIQKKKVKLNKPREGGKERGVYTTECAILTHYGQKTVRCNNMQIRYKIENFNKGTWTINDQIDVGNGGKIVGAFSTSHSMVSALPAMSLNSAAGLRERISVAAVVV